MGRSERRTADQESKLATGDRTRRLMKERGVSVARLAAAIRIQQSTLLNFCSGHRSLPGDVVDAMAVELGTSADFLMDRSDDPRPRSVVLEEARARSEARVRDQAASDLMVPGVGSRAPGNHV